MVRVWVRVAVRFRVRDWFRSEMCKLHMRNREIAQRVLQN